MAMRGAPTPRVAVEAAVPPPLPLEQSPSRTEGTVAPDLRARVAELWDRLAHSEIQVDYMKERMLKRRDHWLAALPSVRPTWQPPRRADGSVPRRAIVWPLAAYTHFGVKRVWSLGEYSQWADLCAALTTLAIECKIWPYRQSDKRGLPTQADFDLADLIFTDYQGLHSGWRFSAKPPADKTWVLDTFGTDGTIVDHQFFGRAPPLTDYPLQRFLTLVPEYATRNTFLGAAVVGAHLVGSAPERKFQCVLWSKVQPWLGWENGYHRQLLQEYVKHCKVIATIDAHDTYHSAKLIRDCCPEVEIRGVQSGEAFATLLRSSAVYLGVGEPLIAPSCFEALSLGTHVIQPRHPTPQVLKQKPITQSWTSQHPFLEQVPEPYAFTIDPLDKADIARAFAKIRAAFDAGRGNGASAGRVDLGASSEQLRTFYSSGVYPKSDVYAITGFLTRVARIVRQTRPLVASDWEWELKEHPQQLPKWVQDSVHMQ
eukprot:TRINITY_DN21258_c0_g1_i2.p1 TRINITY_DN21258_c0_g1~~TRINITY_DN21258_c0_g1_i2.p1  ORF type:complete len:551 (-),score=103.88 TRINITY_DN21258_c0_g1_i2:500-1951(-)